MSRVYCMSRDIEEIKTAITANVFKGLELVHKPIGHDNKPSLWPYAVKDSVGNHGWFEAPNMILFWGSGDETPILNALARKGINVEDSF